MIDVNIIRMQWEEILNWFSIQPILGQILILVGVIAIIALVITLVYYMLKGIYYLFKGIGLLFYKACEALHYAITDKPKPGSEPIPQPVVIQTERQPEPIAPIQKSYQHIQHGAGFCTECGTKFTDTMMQTLSNKGSGFCIHCGKGFQSNPIEIEF